jgi:UTP--glucose-1-phosphate uridylyltransferase
MRLGWVLVFVFITMTYCSVLFEICQISYLWYSIFAMEVSQAILPVAGLGTRFLPWTKVVPKEFLPIGNKPMIALLVDECLDAGITDICFVISKGKEMIPEYFKKDPALQAELESRGKGDCLKDLDRYDSVHFHTVYQDEQLGDGHAILQAGDWVQGPTAILFGDDYFTGSDTGIQQLINASKDQDECVLIALENIPRESTHKYGIVDIEESPRALKAVKGLVEKPTPEDAPSTLGIVGRYIIPKSTFDILPSVESGHWGVPRGPDGTLRGEIRLIDALIKQLGDVPIYGYECEGTRVDTGTPEGYKDAINILL